MMKSNTKINTAVDEVYQLYKLTFGTVKNDDMLEKTFIEFYKINNSYTNEDKIKIWDLVSKKLI